MPHRWLPLLVQKRKRKRKRKKRASSSNSGLEGGYDIFLSFSGEDTRMKFTDHLYEALEQVGFNTFRDEDKINKGKTIKSELRKGIRNSRMSVVVLSKNYAHSKACLFELRMILKHRKDSGHFVLPVFHEVDLRKIKKQAEELDFRKMKAKVVKVKRWSAALKKVARIAGVVFGDQSNRYEAKCIKTIVGILKSKQAGKNPRVGNHLVRMVPNILALKDIILTTKNYTVQAMVIEKNIPRMTTTNSSLYQRMMLQDKEGNMIQATIFGDNIKVLEHTLKLYHAYSITNATVSETPEEFCFLKNIHQLAISARTPVEEIQIDGLTSRTMKYNFTPIVALSQIRDPNPKLDVLFAILEVGPRKYINDSYVVEVRVVDQSFQPTIISLWGQFSDYEAPVMVTLPGNFPVAIGLRLKTSTYYGLTLATRSTSSFIFNPPIPEATTLQSWCAVNARKIKELPTAPSAQLLMPKPTEYSEDDIIKIVNLPISVDKTQYLNVQGIAKVTDFTQNFYYLACSLCNKATNAFGDGDFLCNYCVQKVPALTKIKFNVQITDLTGTIEATVFSEVASKFYGITATNAIYGQLPLPILQKLGKPKKCIVTLKAYMYSYAGISQLKFNVHSISNEDIAETTNRSEILFALPPNTPNKKSKKRDHKSTTQAPLPPAQQWTPNGQQPNKKLSN